MQGISAILLTIMLAIFGCQSEQRLTDEYLIGKWEVSEISAKDVELFGEPFNTDMVDIEQSFEFTKTKIYMRQEKNSVVMTFEYKFSPDDSNLIMTDQKNNEATKLIILSENEFQLKDNMGLLLNIKKVE